MVKYLGYVLTKSRKVTHNTLTVHCEKSKMVSFASSVMKRIVLPQLRSRFSVKLI